MEDVAKYSHYPSLILPNRALRKPWGSKLILRAINQNSLVQGIITRERRQEHKVLHGRFISMAHHGLVQLISLKDINPKYSLKGLMLKLKLQYFGHLM